MKSIALYVEGGGDSQAGKAALRQGFDQLLARQKSMCRSRKIRWQTAFWGGRDATIEAFLNAATKRTADLVALVVDAEAPVTKATPEGRAAHLRTHAGWTFGNVEVSCVHLMTQCMEAWIVADDAKVAEFYGKGFRSSALPKRKLLDEEPKGDLQDALKTATRDTQKGTYAKIKHASELLKRVRPAVVTARCDSFKHFVEWLDVALDQE